MTPSQTILSRSLNVQLEALDSKMYLFECCQFFVSLIIKFVAFESFLLPLPLTPCSEWDDFRVDSEGGVGSFRHKSDCALSL